MPTALLIKKCSHGGWYKDLIGKMVPNLGDEGIEFKSRQPSGFINFVSKSDCDVVVIDDLDNTELY